MDINGFWARDGHAYTRARARTHTHTAPLPSRIDSSGWTCLADYTYKRAASLPTFSRDPRAIYALCKHV